MAINPPVDATKTPEWAALQKHYDELQSEGISLKQWFADDAERVEKLSFDAGDLHFDLSKNLIKPETLQLFADLAKAVKLDERTKAMYTGVHINNTEDRAVLHTALRRPVEDEGKYIVDGQDTVKDVREVLDRIYAFADKVRSGEWTGVTGKKIETVVNIGIGGSDLGPVMVYEALKPYADAGISARYISNIDPNDLAEKTKGLDPETTLFIIVSKTFTTLETLTNAREARTWLLEELKAKGAIDGSDAKNAEAIKKHFVAVSTNLEKVAEFGIDPNNAFGFWNWVGGRYSVDSAVGTSLAVVFGPARFEEFLHGFHEIDEYFANTPFEKNVVVLLGTPGALALFFEVSLFALSAILLAPLGTVMVAGHQIALNFGSLTFMVPLSLCMTVTIRVGRCLGAQQLERAKLVARTGLILSVVFALVIAIFTVLFRHGIVRIYTDNPEVTALAVHLLLFQAAYQVVDGLQVTGIGVLRGYNDTRIISAICFIAYWVIGLPLGFVLARTNVLTPPMGAQGFWIAYIVALGFGALCYLLRVRFLHGLAPEAILLRVRR